VPELPNQDLTGEVLYEFLIAEIAGQRGNLALSAQAYADLAKRTRDPRVAERATEMALHARMPEAAIESAKVWAESSPGNGRALATASSLLIRANRLDEAEPYLQKAGDAECESQRHFLRPDGLLANNPDKATNLRVMQRWRSRTRTSRSRTSRSRRPPPTPARTSSRSRRSGRPGACSPTGSWRCCTRRRCCRKPRTRPQPTASRGISRPIRSRARCASPTHVRWSPRRISPKRAGSSSSCSRTIRAAPTSCSPSVLSMQLEDWPGAEANLKRLLDLGYADRNSVRFYLGQVTEEQKRFPEALQWYGEVTRSDQFMPAQIRTAQVMSKQGNLDGARKYLQNVSAANNDQRAQLIIAEAQLLRDANQPKEAFAVIEVGLGELPNNPDLLYDHAMLAEKLDRMDILESSLRKVIALRPDHAHAYNALGYSLADRNVRLDEARLIDRRSSADDYYIIDSLGGSSTGRAERRGAEELRRAYAGGGRGIAPRRVCGCSAGAAGQKIWDGRS
jgi:tetratricopeptide (TPR) repeat protein